MAVELLDGIQLALLGFQFLSTIIVFSVTADKLKHSIDISPEIQEHFCEWKGAPDERGNATCNSVIALSVIAWLIITTLLILYIVDLIREDSSLASPLSQFIALSVVTVLTFIVAIITVALHRSGKNTPSSENAARAFAWLGFLAAAASTVIAGLAMRQGK